MMLQAASAAATEACEPVAAEARAAACAAEAAAAAVAVAESMQGVGGFRSLLACVRTCGLLQGVFGTTEIR